MITLFQRNMWYITFIEGDVGAFIHDNSCQLTRELVIVMNCNYATTLLHLHFIGNVQISGTSLALHGKESKPTSSHLCSSSFSSVVSSWTTATVSILVCHLWPKMMHLYQHKKWRFDNTPRSKVSAHRQLLCTYIYI